MNKYEKVINYIKTTFNKEVGIQQVKKKSNRVNYQQGEPLERFIEKALILWIFKEKYKGVGDKLYIDLPDNDMIIRVHFGATNKVKRIEAFKLKGIIKRDEIDFLYGRVKSLYQGEIG
ncbi:MAG: hypothetical protein DRN30_02890 [Thermoplasmata archaeon]|nr:MAG: hypothetical protein DRN30_02890 [Thermoplasmata archaeon]